MRFAVIGKNGMFGSEMIANLTSKDIEVHGFNRSNLNLDASAGSLAESLRGIDVVINAVGYTAVDRAELETNEANKVNGHYAGALAKAASLVGARFIHISTDYVFDGSLGTPYNVEEPVNPQTVYGKSKALGEKLVAESGADYSILRTAWLYGAYGRCFPKVITEVLNKNGNVRVVNDQIGQPTWTRDLAEQVLQVVQLKKMPRIVHAVSSGKASWSEFAQEVALSIGRDIDSIEGISSIEFPTAAMRPAWSVLENSGDLFPPIGDWRERWREAAPSVLKEAF